MQTEAEGEVTPSIAPNVQSIRLGEHGVVAIRDCGIDDHRVASGYKDIADRNIGERDSAQTVMSDVR